MIEFKRYLRRGHAAFVFAAGLFFLALPRAFSEVPVGLSAQGVSLRYALHNFLHVDMRDATGRPVSAPLIRKEIKISQAKSRARAAFSSLPKARQVSFFLECLWRISIFSWSLSTFKTLARVWALPAPKKRDWTALFRLLMWDLLVLGAFLALNSLSFFKEVSHRNFAILLC